jgi:hypothetical protein
MKTKILLSILLACGLWGSCACPALAQVTPPTLSLKDAIVVAENALTQAQVDLSRYYIYSVIYTNSSQGTCWSFSYKTKAPSVAQEIHVKVFMNQKTEFSGGYFT